MSSPAKVALPFLLMAGTLVGACASTPEPATGITAQTELPVASPDDISPAEARAIADRLPPLEKANYWAQQYAANPVDLETALQFGDALRGIGSNERAIEVMRDAAVVHPASADVMVVMGRAYVGRGEHEQARRAFQIAITREPGHADAMAGLGLAYDRLGEHLSAQAAYLQALEAEPGRVSTLSNLGLSLAMTGQIEQAEQRLREAFAIAPENTMVRQNLALVLGLQGRYDAMMEVAGDAPESVMQSNVEALRNLRGDPAPLPGEASAAAGLRGSSSGS